MSESDRARAGRIILLVGAILQGLGAFFLLGIMGLAGWLTGAPLEGMLIGFIGGALAVAGCVVAIWAWRAAAAGQWHRAGRLGVVASLLPPLQMLTLIGAVLCYLGARDGSEDA